MIFPVGCDMYFIQVAGCTPDSVNGYSCLRQVYTEHDAGEYALVSSSMVGNAMKI